MVPEAAQIAAHPQDAALPEGVRVAVMPIAETQEDVRLPTKTGIAAATLADQAVATIDGIVQSPKPGGAETPVGQGVGVKRGGVALRDEMHGTTNRDAMIGDRPRQPAETEAPGKEEIATCH